MLKRNNKGFTLIEIIISIAVLSIISAIFLELFIKADTVQKQGKSLDNKAFLISNLFEILTAEENIEGFIEQSAPATKQAEGERTELIFYYDRMLQAVAEEKSQYTLHLEFKKTEALKSGNLYVVTAKAFEGMEGTPMQMMTNFYEQKGEGYEAKEPSSK